MCGFSLALYMLLVYLLSKMIIEKNAQSISMLRTPRLHAARDSLSIGTGHRRGRVAHRDDPIVLVMKWLFYYYMHEISGWLTFYIALWTAGDAGLGAATYFVVHLQTKRLEHLAQ